MKIFPGVLLLFLAAARLWAQDVPTISTDVNLITLLANSHVHG
jgi:hypothetical protein